MESENKRQLVFLIFLAVAICLFVFTLTFLIKNRNIIAKDPLIYGMKIHNFSSCSCFDFSGDEWHNSNGIFIHEENIKFKIPK